MQAAKVNIMEQKLFVQKINSAYVPGYKRAIERQWGEPGSRIEDAKP
jgi:hypothetical protein